MADVRHTIVFAQRRCDLGPDRLDRWEDFSFPADCPPESFAASMARHQVEGTFRVLLTDGSWHLVTVQKVDRYEFDLRTWAPGEGADTGGPGVLGGG